MSVNELKAATAKPFTRLTLAALAILILAAIFQTVPGYMDAEYYDAGGMQLVHGQGFNEPFLWNYLDQPAGIPHPSHTYWMPLASILAYLGMKITGAGTFLAARWPFMLLAALIPWLTYRLANILGAKPASARLAGWLAVFPGFYLIFTTLTETFVLYMLGGTLFFILLSLNDERWRNRFFWIRYGLLGLLAGWMHVSRADGALWLGLAGLVWLVETIQEARARGLNWRRAGVGVILLGMGYLLLMGAWFTRNLSLSGTLFSPGGSRTLWLTSYDQTYTFQAGALTFQNWLAAGWGAALKARWDALVLNLKNLLAVQGSVFLLPFILIGAWKKRQCTIVRWGALGWLLTLFVMTVVFPFSGGRGGFLHSGAAFQPLGWACAAIGLETAIDAGTARFGWQRGTAWRVFSGGAVALAALLTVGVFWMRVAQPGMDGPLWNASDRAYRQAGEQLNALGIADSELCMVNNPPGFFLATGRSSIVIPDGEEEELLAAARRYGAKILILDSNNPALDDLYRHATANSNFQFLSTIGSMNIYRISP